MRCVVVRRDVPAVVALAIFVLGSLVVAPVEAQPNADSSRSHDGTAGEPRVTLEGWAQNHRLLVLDRRHNRGDRLYDRGLFRHVTPRKDREYALDMFAQRFSWDEVGFQRRASNSMHLRVGSVRRDLFAFMSHLQSTVDVASAHSLTIDGVFQQDAEALRPFLELGYGWDVATHHTIGVRHTFSEYKPDLDVTAFYAYNDPSMGRAELSVTLQNLYSDLIDQHLHIPPEFRDIIRSYERRPYLMILEYRSPDRWPIRAEVVAAAQPTSRVIYESQTESGYRYQEQRALHYGAVLLEYHRSEFSGGLFFKEDMSWLRRQGRGSQVESQYTAEQAFWRFGIFVNGKQGPLYGSLRGFTGSYRDTQSGRDFSQSVIPRSLGYDETQWGLRSRLEYRWSAGPVVGLGYDALRRTYNGPFALNEVGNPVALSQWATQWKGVGAPGPTNHRLVTLVGYRFPRGKLELGFGMDLDGDNDHPGKSAPKRFDNGFGRLILTW